MTGCNLYASVREIVDDEGPASLDALEVLSSTDVECYWGKVKSTVKETYSAIPILLSACLINKLKKKEMVAPNSNLAKHITGRTLVDSTAHCSSALEPKTPYVPPSLTILLRQMEASSYVNKIARP
ncbi:hypothetical protein ILUMI_21672 [Ignelater luminosus]|uniref:Uncharacterized protein n=1 Tax=Ignelater luminosus TaxID=2038154 RepID=A0A8K0CC11_IGNLU|nr:hypothetical protein ILUMI_21672 [Ignelater luminosus]